MEDRWDAADRYEQFMGRWSRALAPRFLNWAHLPPGRRILDLGCGTGALSAALVERSWPGTVGIDRSFSFASSARQGPGAVSARTDFVRGDAMHLPFRDGTFDAIASALVLNFVPEPAQALREARRVVRPGGTVAFCVWDYAAPGSFLRHFWDAAVALDPERARALDEAVRFPICHRERLGELVRAEGFRDVTVAGIEIPTAFRDFQDFWRPFEGGQAPAPGYAMSLPPERRTVLREHIRARLPVGADGRITLASPAWAVRGTKP